MERGATRAAVASLNLCGRVIIAVQLLYSGIQIYLKMKTTERWSRNEKNDGSCLCCHLSMGHSDVYCWAVVKLFRAHVKLFLFLHKLRGRSIQILRYMITNFWHL